MAVYFLSYDLRKKRDYQKLHGVLSGFSGVRVLESTWCFNRRDTSAKSLREYFKGFIDADD